ncbi:MAG: hypothetical protein NTY84_15535, partial [Verrucomicrobia bacterium]|nr:hypothetical protein [Verrucomicrobiota bacterium]
LFKGQALQGTGSSRDRLFKGQALQGTGSSRDRLFKGQALQGISTCESYTIKIVEYYRVNNLNKNGVYGDQSEVKI